MVAKLNDELIDMSQELTEDGKIELILGGEDGYENLLNHSCAHMLAQAIKQLYPNAMFGVGPAIEEGFYYDIDDLRASRIYERIRTLMEFVKLVDEDYRN